jgi:hypothetical protein
MHPEAHGVLISPPSALARGNSGQWVWDCTLVYCLGVPRYPSHECSGLRELLVNQGEVPVLTFLLR